MQREAVALRLRCIKLRQHRLGRINTLAAKDNINLVIRDATVKDSATVLGFIKELAVFEKAEHEVHATLSDVEVTLFGDTSTVHAVIGEVDKEPTCMAVYFYNYSTWLGKNGLYLEDLYVSPAHRGRGMGRAMLAHLARIAIEKDCGRFEWSVLDWNAPAIQLYESVGAVKQSEWIGYRVSGDALRRLADNTP